MATITKGKTFVNGELVTPEKLHQLVDAATLSPLVNADIASNAAIADTKLAQISTAGKVLPAAVQGTAVITSDSRLSDARPPTTHTHDDRYYTETEMNNLLAGKQASGSYAPATGIAPSAITGTAVITTDSRLSDARTPTTHNHDDRYYTEAEIDTKLSGLPVSGHTHTIANVTGLQTALDGKQASGSYAPATGIAQSSVTNLTTDLAGKAASSHTHTIANVTGLQTALDGKQASGSYALSLHNHDASQITSGTLGNARTTAASTNTPGAIVLRDAEGNFSANIITANLTGTASGNAPASHTHDASAITSGTLTNARTTATSNNTVNAIVARDDLGDFRARVITVNGLTQKLPDNSTDIFSVSSLGAGTGQGCKVDVSHTDGMGAFVPFVSFNYANSSIGSIKRVSESSVAYTTTSDYRLKTNIEPLTAAVARLLQIPAHRFNWLADPNGQKVDGFLAHEAQAVVPESVTGTKDAVDADGKPIHQGIDQSKLVPLLVAAVQELAARVAALEAK
jgi:hypothetical protein